MTFSFGSQSRRTSLRDRRRECPEISRATVGSPDQRLCETIVSCCRNHFGRLHSYRRDQSNCYHDRNCSPRKCSSDCSISSTTWCMCPNSCLRRKFLLHSKLQRNPNLICTGSPHRCTPVRILPTSYQHIRPDNVRCCSTFDLLPTLLTYSSKYQPDS